MHLLPKARNSAAQHGKVASEPVNSRSLQDDGKDVMDLLLQSCSSNGSFASGSRSLNT